MERNTKLSYLIQLSWETSPASSARQIKNKYDSSQIQRKKKHNRSKSLQAAWAITPNEDITIYYLVKRQSNKNAPNKVQAKNLALFSKY